MHRGEDLFGSVSTNGKAGLFIIDQSQALKLTSWKKPIEH